MHWQFRVGIVLKTHKISGKFNEQITVYFILEEVDRHRDFLIFIIFLVNFPRRMRLKFADL
jgi:hypothetical protein